MHESADRPNPFASTYDGFYAVRLVEEFRRLRELSPVCPPWRAALGVVPESGVTGRGPSTGPFWVGSVPVDRLRLSANHWDVAASTRPGFVPVVPTRLAVNYLDTDFSGNAVDRVEGRADALVRPSIGCIRAIRPRLAAPDQGFERLIWWPKALRAVGRKQAW